MKLIDILVQELPKRGGWPEGAEIAVQDTFIDNDIKFGGKGCQIPTAEKEKHGDIVWRSDDWNFSSDIDFATEHPASDYATAIITREQYEAALKEHLVRESQPGRQHGGFAHGYAPAASQAPAADADGWIEWGGGECPVDTKTLVDIKLKDGFTYKSCHAGDYSWRHVGGGGDIIAYRPHNPQEATQSDEEADLNECIGQDVATVWNGEGMPPVGCECEYSLNAGKTWWKCKIDYIVGTQGVVMLCDTFEGVQYVQFSSYGSALKFRPIRSEADKKREEAIMSIAKAGGAASFEYGEKFNDGSLIGAAWYELYDAIAAGKVRGVKLED